MNYYFFLINMLFFATNSLAQITLKQHHFFSIGDTIVEHYNRLPQNPINIGESGENRIWDFSDLDAIAVNKNTLKFIDPKETPFATEYPDSNIVLYSKDIYESWGFMKSSRKRISNLGYGVLANKEKRTGNLGGIDMKLPLRYLDESSNESVAHRVLFKNIKGQDSIKIKTVSKHKYKIDSWGDVILPQGTFISLRLKYTLDITNYIYQRKGDKWNLLIKPETKSTISYKWWTDNENAKYPVVQIVMDEANEKPIVVHYLEANPFSEIIEEVDEEEIKIYPNPATEKLFVEFPKSEETYTTIYSLEGKIVINKKTNLPKIEIDISHLAAATYLIINRSKAGQIIGKSKFIKI